MTQSREPHDRDIYTRVARLEYRLTQIENTNTQLQDTIAPGGYVTDGFERVVDRIDEVDDRLNTKIDGVEERLNIKIDGVEERLNTKIDGVEERLNAKLDIIIRQITGMVQQ
jgi:archaellum component FlaC